VCSLFFVISKHREIARWALAPALLVSLLLFPNILSAGPQSRPPASSTFAKISSKADAAREANRLDEAVVLYKKALALRPKWAEGWWSLGTIQYDRNAYADAVSAFKAVLRLKPTDGTAHAMLGLSEFELGRDKQALQHIEKGKELGIAKDPQLRNVVLYHDAVLLQRAEKFEAAKQTLQQMCLEGIESDQIATILGMVLLRAPDKAVPPPGSRNADVVSRIGHAECLAGKKNYEQAHEIFEALVQQYPTYPNIHYAYGMFLLDAQDTAAAVTEFKQEIENTPNHVFARLQIAAANYKTDSAAGLPYATEAVKLNPRLPFAHYLVGLLLLDTDNYQKAIPELEIAKKSLPRESKLYFALGSAYSRAGREQEARQARQIFTRLQQAEQARGDENSGLSVH
jgi:tetratricopeptide (TPR) repeat protein